MSQAKATFFDGEADTPWATKPYGPVEEAKIHRMLAAAEIRRGMRVLEPGCGTGRLTEILADAVGPEGWVVALDISAKMVGVCRRRVGSRGNLQVLQVAAEEMPRDLGPFDIVVCHQVFPHFDDKAAALITLERVLKPLGRLLVAHFINGAAVNDVHRMSDSVIKQDLLPASGDMHRLFEAAGLLIDMFHDDELGYLVRATRVGQR